MKKPKKKHVYAEHISFDLRSKDDQVPPTNDALSHFTSSLETSGCNPAILPLLSKLYGKKPSWPIKEKDLQSVVSPELAKSVAETTSENGIIKETKLVN